VGLWVRNPNLSFSIPNSLFLFRSSIAKSTHKLHSKWTWHDSSMAAAVPASHVTQLAGQGRGHVVQASGQEVVT